MDAKQLGWGLTIVGVIVVVVFAFADQLGIGGAPGTFGWKQILGVIVGVLLIGAGQYRLRAA